MKEGTTLLRISIALIFLYFGTTQAINPDSWTGYIPEQITGTIITANNWVILNSILELTLGTMLLLGLYTRTTALILGLHLAIITINIGFNPTGIRDLGLTIATLLLYLNKEDNYTLDQYFKKKPQKS